MLLGNFFTITNLITEDGGIRATILINAGHKIFEGHFPGQPVVPGVCMMQMVQEITAKALQKKLQLATAGEMKFLAVIDPRENNTITITAKFTEPESGHLTVTAVFSSGEMTHFKFKGTFAVLASTEC